jgi:hypothetical protein
MTINIPIQQARQLFTQAFLGAWRESFPVTNFFRSFTTDKTTSSKYISIEVSRGTKKIAVDVMRGSESNRNKFGLSTLKAYLPPYYYESFTNEDLALYDQLFATYGEVTLPQIIADLSKEVTANYLELRNKIERAYEKQAAEVFQTGTVTLKNGDSIDYKMKATHKLTLDTKWDATTPKIFSSIRSFCDTLKADGAAAVEFDFIFGATALTTFLESDEYAKKYGLYPTVTSQYNLPRAEQTSGAVFHNRIAAGPYILNIWSYGETYTNESGADTPYLDPKKVVVIAKSMQAYMSFGAVPRVLTDNGIMQNPQFAQTIENGKYILNNFVKPEVSSHIFDIKSAGVMVPMTIDHFGCMTVLS